MYFLRNVFVPSFCEIKWKTKVQMFFENIPSKINLNVFVKVDNMINEFSLFSGKRIHSSWILFQLSLGYKIFLFSFSFYILYAVQTWIECVNRIRERFNQKQLEWWKRILFSMGWGGCVLRPTKKQKPKTGWFSQK